MMTTTRAVSCGGWRRCWAGVFLLLLLLLLPPHCSWWSVVLVGAAGGASSFRRTVAKDSELSDASLLANGTSTQPVTRIQCAGWCASRSGCNAYSFLPVPVRVSASAARGPETGLCKLGTSPFARQTKIDSAVYHLAGSTDTSKTDGSTYVFATIGTFTFTQAMAYCLRNQLGNLPVVYPNAMSLLAVNRTLRSTADRIFVDMRRVGDFSNRKFVTGLGELVDANDKDWDSAQRWAPGQPDAVSNSSGTYVVMTWLGLEDVPDTHTVNSVVCQADGSYRLIPETGKYYQYTKTTVNVPDSRRLCLADGAILATTYKSAASGRSAVWDQFRDLAGYQWIWVGGTMNVVPGQIMQFEDGTLMNYTAASQDPRQLWALGEPDRVAAESCLIMTSNGWFDHFCSEAFPRLCERDAP